MEYHERNAMTKKFFNVFKAPSADIAPPITKIHLKCNDNEANANVVNSGSLGGYATASANTDTISTSGKINTALDLSVATLDLSTFASSLTTDNTGNICFHLYSGFGSVPPPDFNVVFGTATDNITINFILATSQVATVT